ncbi:MAG: 16S rRNA (guanine(527)-N(7))-methyltransferase RsmG [Gammaproteobacteria bacterium]|nr:16S rRNA (guanine(527)-N(7))-methyltransferase RsmG [Gammaproteobacteria bacterium]
MLSQVELPAKLLSAGIKTLNLDCSLDVQARLLDYVRLLHKWNRVYNLTAVRDPAQMVTRHLLDSLTVLPYLNKELSNELNDGRDRGTKPQWILDVGTGAGLPGIPLALLSAKSYPERRFVLLDSNSKKTRFMRQAMAELALNNVQVVHARTEAFQTEQAFDVVLSRAFASVTDMLAGAGRHCTPGGVMLAMKGADPGAELQNLHTAFALEKVYPLQVPGLHEERHLVCLRRVSESGEPDRE